ncbi:MAG: hypothetical protein H7Z17_00795 [Fuerstia sp.]|nr:hypothetical protein [Fuerstiella sp.]
MVLAIELRAGLGQSNSANALAAVSTDGLFNNLALSDARKLLSLSPNETIIRDNEREKVFHYQWISLLRPVMGQPQPELFLVSSPTEPAYAITFYTDPEDARSGFFGDAIPLMMPEAYEEPSMDNLLGLPNAPVTFPAPDTQPEVVTPTETVTPTNPVPPKDPAEQ